MQKILITLSPEQHALLLSLMERDLVQSKSAYIATLLVAEHRRGLNASGETTTRTTA